MDWELLKNAGTEIINPEYLADRGFPTDNKEPIPIQDLIPIMANPPEYSAVNNVSTKANTVVTITGVDEGIMRYGNVLTSIDEATAYAWGLLEAGNYYVTRYELIRYLPTLDGTVDYEPWYSPESGINPDDELRIGYRFTKETYRCILETLGFYLYDDEYEYYYWVPSLYYTDAQYFGSVKWAVLQITED